LFRSDPPGDRPQHPIMRRHGRFRGPSAEPAAERGPPVPHLRRPLRGAPVVTGQAGRAARARGPRGGCGVMAGRQDDVVARALDLDALAGYLRGRGIPVEGALTARRLSGGKSNLTFRVADESGATWVVRRPPLAGLTPSAHDMSREYRVTAALGATEVPVARARALCEDVSVIGAPFTVTDFVDGLVVRTADDLAAVSEGGIEACTEEMVRVLAALHSVDYASVGLGDFGRPQGYL